MSRRGGSTRGGDYEEEEHFSRRGPRGSKEEFDSYKRRGPAPAEFAPPPPRERERERQLPDFLRDDYSRREVDNGPLVLRQKDVETFSRGERDRPRPRSPSPERERVVRTRVVERARSLSPEPVERVRRIIRRDRSDSPPSPERERIVRTRVVERERERSPSPPPPERERVIRTRVVERERERSPSPPPERMIRTRIIERSRERERTPSPSPPPPQRVRTRTIEIQRNRSPSPPPERTTTRIVEREDFRRKPRSPSPERERSRIVVRERIREPSPPSPSPSPPLPPIIREPAIHQDIITHHHHYNIDHGVLYEPAPVPSPPPPPRVKPRKDTEIDIYTSKNQTEIDIFKGKAESSKGGSPSSKAGGSRDEDDIFFERDRERLRVRDNRPSRRRSVSTRRELDRWDDEAEYYNRKAEERGYMGEAWNGATKDWAIVDVPPGTERVVMDGIGGGGQEVTWAKYNGVRRSKFIPSRGEKERDRESSRGDRDETKITFREEKVKEIEPPREKEGKEMAVYEREYEREEITGGKEIGKWGPRREREHPYWTEITKDLVCREAIEEMGYEFDETEDFFYVIQYLRYEDVLHLVKITEDIRAERKERIREIAWEKEREEKRREKERRREEKLLKEVGPVYEDERIYEREIVYDGGRRETRRYLR